LPEYRDFTIEADAQELLVNTADGDARRLLNLLEQLLRAADTRRLIQILRDKTGIACHVYVFRFCYITRKRVCNDFKFFPRL